MTKGMRIFATLTVLACLAVPCYAQQTTQQQDDEEAPKPKPRPAPKDAGFGAPEPVAPKTNTQQQQDTNFTAPETAGSNSTRPEQRGTSFAAPETVGPTSARPEQRDTNFAVPETVTPDELPARKGASETSSSGTNPLMGSARARLIEIRNATDIRGKTGQAFRMHAVFSGLSDPELGTGGTYAEWWLSNTRWRREGAIGPVRIVETRDGDKLYRQIVGREYAPRLLDELMDAMHTSFPPLGASSFVEADWQQGSVLYGGTSALRIATGFSGNGAAPDARAYWLNNDGALIAAYRSGTTVEYTDYDPWGGKQVARHLSLKSGGTKVAVISIDQLEGATAEAGTQFVLDGVTPVVLSEEGYSGPYFVPPHPVHQVAPKDPPEGTGSVAITVSLDEHGHVLGAKVNRGINAAVDAAAIKAAMQWEFAPGLVKGVPAPSEATVEFTF